MNNALGTARNARTLLVHLGALFFVIFPFGVLVLIIIKSFLSLLFVWFDAMEYADGYFWIFDTVDYDVQLWLLEACALSNCTAAFVAFVVFMIRVLLKTGELPPTVAGTVTLFVRLGFRIVALPLLTVIVCAISSLAIHFVFGNNPLISSYFSLSLTVLLPTAIGTWIWVWRGDWIPSLELAETADTKS